MDYLFKTIRKFGEQQWCSSLAVDLRSKGFRVRVLVSPGFRSGVLDSAQVSTVKMLKYKRPCSKFGLI